MKLPLKVKAPWNPKNKTLQFLHNKEQFRFWFAIQHGGMFSERTNLDVEAMYIELVSRKVKTYKAFMECRWGDLLRLGNKEDGSTDDEFWKDVFAVFNGTHPMKIVIPKVDG